METSLRTLSGYPWLIKLQPKQVIIIIYYPFILHSIVPFGAAAQKETNVDRDRRSQTGTESLCQREVIKLMTGM